MNRTIYFILCAVITLAPSLTPAATGRILSEVEAQQADTTALAAEAGLFKSIGTGIALALSHCEEQQGCNPNVSKDELGHLLDTLDKRISDLTARQEQKQGDYTEVLTAYVDQRENYLRYQADLDKISGGATGAADAPTKTAPTETATVKKPKTSAKKQKAGGSEGDVDVFSDVDKPLE